jgi:hypothetical protein
MHKMSIIRKKRGPEELPRYLYLSTRHGNSQRSEKWTEGNAGLSYAATHDVYCQLHPERHTSFAHNSYEGLPIPSYS